MRPLIVLFGVGMTVMLTEALPGATSIRENISYNPKKGFLDAIFPKGVAKSRQKRYLSLPNGSNLECRWLMNFPFDTFTLYHSEVAIGLPMKIPLPCDLVGGFNKYDCYYYYHDEEEEGHGRIGEYENEGNSYPGDYEYDVTSHGWQSRRRRAARSERTYVYNYLTALFEKAGLDGRACVLRTICDIAEAPLDQGLFGELINILLTPSPAGRPEHESEGRAYDELIEAELHGKLNGKCEYRYNKCKVSPFTLLPQFLASVMKAF